MGVQCERQVNGQVSPHHRASQFQTSEQFLFTLFCGTGLLKFVRVHVRANPFLYSVPQLL